jgi:threonine/homoserine/homoserine lactone efflux protein
MSESILTVSITGLLAGFIFAMPIAGPISILITSNALKGRLRYCNLVSLGASFADFTFVFIAVYGVTKLYSFYAPVIPYMYTIGAVFFIFLGYKIFTTKFDIEHLEDKTHLVDKIKKRERGGFYTGLMINFLNPTLFIGSLTSSFFVLSLIASLGFHTGGLAVKMDQNLKEINKIEGAPVVDSVALKLDHIERFGNYPRPNRYLFLPISILQLVSVMHSFWPLAVYYGFICWRSCWYDSDNG